MRSTFASLMLFAEFRTPHAFGFVMAGLTFAQPTQALEPSEVFAKASPSVVFIRNATTTGSVFTGSGVTIAPNYVATNCHVVADARLLLASSATGKVVATVARRDEARDLCLLEANVPGSVPARLADARGIHPGNRVYSIGAPKGLELTISEGLVSGLRSLNGLGQLIQTSAAISHGSSGGGLFDSEGALVGFTTLMLKDGQNLNFAVPAVVASELLKSHLANSTPALDKDAASNAMRSALLNSTGNLPSPKPAFDTNEGRMAYLRWLDEMSRRLASAEAEPTRRVEFLEALWYESTRAGLEPSLVLAVVDVMSGFRRYNTNAEGARGYMHVHPFWATSLLDGEPQRLFHMQVNLRTGCVVLRLYLDKAGGDLKSALATYYAQSVGERSAMVGDRRTNDFLKAVVAAQRRWAYNPVLPGDSASRKTP